jgi:hypothetical protein
MGSVGDAYDNALAESFVDSSGRAARRPRRQARSQLQLAVVEYLGWFNNDRLHESLGEIPPAEFEELYAPREPSQISLSRKEPTKPLSVKPGPAQTRRAIGVYSPFAR